MVKRTLILLGLIAVAAWAVAQTQPEPPKRIPSTTGNVSVIPEFESKILNNKRRLVVYLPPNYEKEPNRHFPVLYMHDGQNIFDGATSYLPNLEWQADEAAEALIRAGMIEPIIIVGIDNAGIERANEYLPTKFKPRGGNEMGGKARDYGRMLIEEIMPWVNKTYRTKTGPSNTGLCGSSFGGVITYTLGMWHPNVFGKLGVVSPSVWVNDLELVRMTEALPTKLKSKVWLDMGTMEGPSAVPDIERLAKAMREKGWKDGKDMQLFIDPRAIHQEGPWARRFPLILQFLFGK